MSFYYEILIVVLSFFFSAVTSAFQRFTYKLCLQFSGLRMRNFTWNRFSVKNLLIDSLLTPIVESTYYHSEHPVVQWLLSMPAVWVVINSSLTICFGLASRDENLDGSAFT